MNQIQKDLLSSLFEIDKAGFQRCLEPTMRCEQPAVRAHSIQNARVLDLLANDGHVIGFKRRMDVKTGPQIQFDLIGRSEASTFTGLCASHDQEIFRPIDTREVKRDDVEILFLLAYRAVVRELHATMEGAAKVQAGYQRRVELGLLPEDQPSEPGMFAVERMVISYETFLYKSKYDEALLQKSFDSISHDVFVFENQSPTIAASALFSIDNLHVEDDVVRVALNILPQTENVTTVVFSYLQRDARSARLALNRVLSAAGHHQKYELSRTLINYCENFVVAPSYFATWSDRKKAVIRDYYTKTILKNDLSYEDKDLFLF